jgi:hypothetical protein
MGHCAVLSSSKATVEYPAASAILQAHLCLCMDQCSAAICVQCGACTRRCMGRCCVLLCRILVSDLLELLCIFLRANEELAA